jgi:urease accessory protein
MDIIRAPLSTPEPGAVQILLPIDRLTLAKRRWHAPAEDGREFGFDLAEPLRDGIPFFHLAGATYLIAQQPEPVLEISLATPSQSARLGWLVGNLHFSIELSGDLLRVADDPALRQMLDREHIPFSEASRVFHPLSQGHVH